MKTITRLLTREMHYDVLEQDLSINFGESACSAPKPVRDAEGAGGLNKPEE